ncbi:hypothetical protein [Desulfolutivibrio sulfoxidireducens]|uniref:hypothetical protein n=1 Tax=Desulfolutivibrio sulfoxidireducens TaxID=2773299 RepID=UPI00159D7739|nr:hypothetical protein [Desulfolutivibrio sulfoxidireducens]QLA17123.1 hypothetical protein GD605_13990 [Desulfolutivibrio sulfoxidireducens]QLA20690.1 hypothetical protein GD604_13695 [Desulfolutivibrio sulfoxidireducens]
MVFLVVTTRADRIAEFTAGLASTGAEVFLAESATAALDMAAALKPDLVIADETMTGGPALAFVRKLLTVNAMITTAVVSSLSEEAFHEASEGLGVLARIPVEPTRRDGEELAGKLRRLLLG